MSFPVSYSFLKNDIYGFNYSQINRMVFKEQIILIQRAMMKKIMRVIQTCSVLFFLFTPFISGCLQITDTTQDDTHRFIGTWQNTTGFPAVIVFSSNGTCLYGGG